MNRKNKITIIIPYFGKLPALTAYYFMGCALNREIEFLFFTDQDIDYKLSDNVKKIDFSLKRFNNLVRLKTGLNVKLKYPYKLCDFKPLYGHLFEDYLKESDFWGYTDVDMILGDVDAFVNSFVLEKYDIITARKDSFAGNFTLFRNNSTNRNLYKESNIWKHILSNTHWFHNFDEQFKKCGRPVSQGLLYVVRRFGSKQCIEPGRINDLNEIVKIRHDLKVYYGDFILSDEYLKNRNIVDWEVLWKDGYFKETNSGKEALYFHFYTLKNNKSYLIPQIKNGESLENIFITQSGISFIPMIN